MNSNLTGLAWQVIALFLLCTANLTFSEQIVANQIELKNWNRFSLHNWPTKQDNSSNGRFYYFQGRAGQYEEGWPFARLKKDYFQVNDSLVSDGATVSFKYWSNSESTHLHSSTDRSKSVRLSRSNQWTQVSGLKVNQYQWPYYEFYNQENFTFALKDFQVQYVSNRVPVSPITSFKNESQHLAPNVMKVDLTKMDIAKSGRPIQGLIQFTGLFGSISNVVIPKNWKTIQFKLKLRSLENVFQVQIFNELVPRNVNQPSANDLRYKFVSKPAFPKDLLFAFEFDAHSPNRFILTVAPYVGFAQWDLVLDDGTVLDKNDLWQSDNIALPRFDHVMQSRNYLVKKSAQDSLPYLSLLIEDDDPESETYLTVGKSSEKIVDLYLTLEGESRGRKLAPLDDRLSTFPMSSLIHLRTLGRYQLTFVFSGGDDFGADEEILFNLYTANISLSESAFRGVYMPGATLSSVTFDYVYKEWLLNTPNLTDYTLVSDSGATMYACDILANCYPYERLADGTRTHLHINGKAVWNFTLPEQYKALLEHSPLFRVTSSGPRTTIYGATPYFRSESTSLQRIKSHLTSVSPNLQIGPTSQSSIGFRIKVPGHMRIPLELPILNTIDPRAQTIRTNIRLIDYRNLTSKIHLVSVKLNSSAKVENIRIDSHSQNSQLTISTADYILVRTWKLDHTGVPASFGFEFEVEVDGPDGSLNLNSSMIELEVDISIWNINELIFDRIDSMFLMSPPEGWEAFPDDPSIKSTTLSHRTNPRSLILSKWIPFGSGQLKDNLEGSQIHLRFATFNGTKLTDSDIQVKRIVIGSVQSYFTLTPLKVHVRETVASVLDDFKHDFKHFNNDTTLNGPFRVGYLVELHAHAQVNFEFEPIVKKVNQYNSICGNRSPTYSELNCQIDKYQCPEYYFVEDWRCIRADIPQLVEDECDPSSGCSNLLDRSLPSSSIYSNDAQHLQNAYYPVNINDEPNYIRIPNPSKSSTDFCIQFDYIAYHLAIKLTDSVTAPEEDRNVLSLSHSRSKWFRNQIVCASQLNEKKIDAIYLYFDRLNAHAQQQPSTDIELHMIANLRYVVKL